MSLSVLLKTGAGKFLCWYLGVVAYPSFPACQSFFSSTYWMVFSSTEERKYEGFLQERKADIVERLCWLITITLCCSCKWQFVLFIGTVIITGSAINLYSKTWYCKQSPLIKKEKNQKPKPPQPTYKRKEQLKLKRAAKIIAGYCTMMMESRQKHTPRSHGNEAS